MPLRVGVSKSWKKIMECKRRLQQIVVPVFYDVRPSKMRALEGNLAEVFASHMEHFGEDKLKRWRAALTEAANSIGRLGLAKCRKSVNSFSCLNTP